MKNVIMIIIFSSKNIQSNTLCNSFLWSFYPNIWIKLTTSDWNKFGACSRWIDTILGYCKYNYSIIKIIRNQLIYEYISKVKDNLLCKYYDILHLNFGQCHGRTINFVCLSELLYTLAWNNLNLHDNTSLSFILKSLRW